MYGGKIEIQCRRVRSRIFEQALDCQVKEVPVGLGGHCQAWAILVLVIIIV